MDDLILFGAVSSFEECLRNEFHSEAANRFLLNLAECLIERGVRCVNIIGFKPMGTFPKVRQIFVPGSSYKLAENISVDNSAFINLPIIKHASIFLSMKRNVARLFGGSFEPSAVLTYNVRPFYAGVAMYYARHLGIPLIAILADIELSRNLKISRNPLRYMESKASELICARCDGLIALSRLTIDDLGLSVPWIKLEGGIVEEFRFEQPVPDEARNRTMLFAGSLVPNNGINLLLEAFKLVRDPNCELWITGRGPLEAEVIEAQNQDRRIKYLGFLERKDFIRLLPIATILVNPRLNECSENRYSFPSKLLEYFSAGKPVITTATADVADEYGDKAFILVEETPEALADLIEKACSRPVSVLNSMGANAQKYVLENKSWPVQAARVYVFIDDLIHAKAAVHR